MGKDGRVGGRDWLRVTGFLGDVSIDKCCAVTASDHLATTHLPSHFHRCRSTCLLEVGEHRAALEDACTLIDQDPSMEDAVVLKASALLRLELVRAQGPGTACYVALVSPHLTFKWSEWLNRVWLHLQ